MSSPAGPRPLGWLALAALVGCGCGHEPARPSAGGAGPADSPRFGMSSEAFADGAPIPARFTADGQDVSPALRWEAPPAGTVELALVCHDPDAPRAAGWTHWVMSGIPATLRALPEGIETTERPAAVPGAVAGKNDSGRLGWAGPSPPPGHGVHHYHFVLYALDRPTGLAPGATLRQLEAAIRGHVIGHADLVGTYERR